MFEFLNITKALAEENRLRILLALERHELCVCQLIELLMAFQRQQNAKPVFFGQGFGDI